MKRLGLAFIFVVLAVAFARAFVVLDDTHDWTTGGTLGPINGQKTFTQAILGPVAFSSLGADTNGTLRYCTDCTVNSAPCTGAGTGAVAQRIAGAWRCGAAGVGSGTVTSVGLSMPGTIFSVSSSPVTTAGTLGVTVLGTQFGVPIFATTTTLGTTGAIGACTGTGKALTFDGTATWGCNTTASNTCPAGSDKQLQYNNASSCGATTGIEYHAGPPAGDGLLVITATPPSGGGNGLFVTSTGTGNTAAVETDGIYGYQPAGYTGNGYTSGGFFNNLAAGVGTDIDLRVTTQSPSNAGVRAYAQRTGTGVGTQIGIDAMAEGSTENDIGVLGRANLNNVAGSHFAVMGMAGGSTEATDFKEVGGYFQASGSSDNLSIIKANNLISAIVANSDVGTTGILFTGFEGDFAHGSARMTVRIMSDGSIVQVGYAFLSLPTPTADGEIIYCSNCAKTTPCAGAGTGALAVRLNGAWDCSP